AVAALEPEPATEAIARSIAIKARIVEQDEREETGLRSFLNYGHTIGHALEAAADYRGLLHGEAVAVGMVGAARIGQRLGLLPEESVAKHEALLDRFGLPRRAPGIDAERALAAMALDKKVRRRAIRWVLLEAIGRPVLRDDVPEGLVLEVVGELVAG
ncbi:MAG TPA: 3-dehydroquinate synthase, partial [Dehalococcoidia bacterium]|nr:3-dehydroquinate synthase [Dehalococcoidia bacterium]